MIGNDIVDLALARKESNWKRPGYLDKIFTQNEQLLIATAEHPDIMVWNLWSRKEAAYKIYNRATGVRGYFPLNLVCVYENTNSGSVLCNGYTYYTKTEIVKDKIHTVAVTDKMDFEMVLELDTEIKMVKKKGIPFLVEEKTNSLKPVSLSHHGRYSVLVGLK
ncbi:4'-phosphopantetheinyl transferase superfamily protein [uncultured Flavobacterium sp.]|uniref:4'-phosphopantetheinyl transferase family protein n=1 Tax=uncultured Flavobacterium sp. TaxID=165435 RepID=UPI0030EDBE3D